MIGRWALIVALMACSSSDPMALSGVEAPAPVPAPVPLCEDVEIHDLTGGTPLRVQSHAGRTVVATVGAVWAAEQASEWQDLQRVGLTNGTVLDLVSVASKVYVVEASGRILLVASQSLVPVAQLPAEPTAVVGHGGRLWWVSSPAALVGSWSPSDSASIRVDGWPAALAPHDADSVAVAARHGGVFVAKTHAGTMGLTQLPRGTLAAPDRIASNGRIIAAGRGRNEAELDVWVDQGVRSLELGTGAGALSVDEDAVRVYAPDGVFRLDVPEDGGQLTAIPLGETGAPSTWSVRLGADPTKPSVSGFSVGTFTDDAGAWTWHEQLRSTGTIRELVLSEGRLLVATAGDEGGVVHAIASDGTEVARGVLASPLMPSSTAAKVLQAGPDGVWVLLATGALQRLDVDTLARQPSAPLDTPIAAFWTDRSGLWTTEPEGYVHRRSETHRRLVRENVGRAVPVGRSALGVVSVSTSDGMVFVDSPQGTQARFHLTQPPRTQVRRAAGPLGSVGAHVSVRDEELIVPLPVLGLDRVDLRTGQREHHRLSPGLVDAVDLADHIVGVRGTAGLVVLPRQPGPPVMQCGLPGDARRIVVWEDRVWVSSDGMLLSMPVPSGL